MRKKKILVVDDDPDFVQVVRMRLESNGHEVCVAHDGKEALQRVKTEKPDAVLLDILMPKMDGLKVLSRIRRINKRLPVFILTAFSSEERFGLAKRLNASGFMVKTGDLTNEIFNITSSLSLSDKFHRGS